MVNNNASIPNTLSPAQILRGCDFILEKIILSIAPPQIISTNNVFHDLMSCLLEQQIHYRSTKKIFTKMLEKLDEKPN